ncbi:glycoside hydrolase N-terminal domain-containing protein [Microbacterium sp. H1-D42]|uniref:glycosyl hydrolase family 95 catalytic domain-containing protein n=1 Tax=Microbacterium sp. H1-D42 TaxID=2925844 RepID=UPI001F535570|nr:glycoside hydrolase N-terminal domain-containing protein [Microbacterium sp. H1-D42]UNK70330.1 RICIN domain-containing protein [Microbacterium sp. H1-D42]
MSRRGFFGATAVGVGAVMLPSGSASAFSARASVSGLSAPAVGVVDTTPAVDWTDGFVSGNGEMGAVFHGKPELERVVLNHHRFVRPNGTRELQPPVISHRLSAAQDRALSGDYWGAASTFADGWELHWTQSFHPAYELRIDTPAMVGAGDYARSTDYETGEVVHTWSTPEGVWRRRAFVSRASQVIVHELSAPAGARIDTTIDIDTDLEAAPDTIGYVREAKTSGRNGYLGLRGTYQAGKGAFGFEGVTRAVIAGSGASISAQGNALVIRKATKVTLLTRLARHEDANGWDANPVHSALGEVLPDYDALLRKHTPQHAARFGQSRVRLGVPEADRALTAGQLIARQNDHRGALDLALLERMFDSGRYFFASSSGVLPPRLTALWAGSWDAAWADDFTTDANVNLQIAGANILDHGDSIEGYFNLIFGQLEHWRVNARNIYGARGFLAPSRTDGESGYMLHFNSGSFPGQCWTGGADWLLYPLIEYVQVSGDQTFYRERLAPVLMELALFYEDFLTRTDSDGKRVFVPSFSMENSPSNTGQMLSINATGDIMAGRHALQSAIEAADTLGVEQGAGEGVARWSALLDELPEYRVNSSHDLAEWSWPGLNDRYNHRHVQHLYGAWPLHEVNPEDRADLVHASRHALLKRGDENTSAHGSLHRALAAARLKDGVGVSANLRKVLCNDMVWRSMMTSHNPGRHLYNADAANAIPGILAEALVYSRPGLLELLPALPTEFTHGSIEKVRGRNRVLVEKLSWDLRARSATAVFASDIEQDLTVICRRGIVTMTVDGAPVSDSPLGDHASVLSMSAGTRVTVTYEMLPTLARLVNVNSGDVMDVDGAAWWDGAAVIQWPWSGAGNQKWRLLPGYDGSFRLANVGSGKVLDNPATSMVDGKRLDQWSDGFSPNQWWRAEPSGDGAHRLVNVASGLCLDVEAGSSVDGAKLVQKTIDDASTSQLWRIEAL